MVVNEEYKTNAVADQNTKKYITGKNFTFPGALSILLVESKAYLDFGSFKLFLGFCSSSPMR